MLKKVTEFFLNIVASWSKVLLSKSLILTESSNQSMNNMRMTHESELEIHEHFCVILIL